MNPLHLFKNILNTFKINCPISIKIKPREDLLLLYFQRLLQEYNLNYTLCEVKGFLKHHNFPIDLNKQVSNNKELLLTILNISNTYFRIYNRRDTHTLLQLLYKNEIDVQLTLDGLFEQIKTCKKFKDLTQTKDTKVYRNVGCDPTQSQIIDI